MALPALNRIYAAASGLQAFCEERNWRFCFIGGVAVQRWGEPRVTLDADLTLLTGFEGEERYIDEVLATFSPRRPDAREFALKYRVLLVQHPNGVPLDIALGALPFEVSSIDRSSIWDAQPGCKLRTCSAEDLVVHKAFAGRPQDWVDLERVLIRQSSHLDAALILRELTPLAELKEQPDILDQLRLLFRKVGIQP